MVEASEAVAGCEVDETLADCAYGAGETRAEFAASGRSLIAKVPELQNQGYFVKTDFQIDLEARTCRCPNGQITTELRPNKEGGGLFVFAAETCAACPLRPQCTRGRSGRMVQLNPHEALLQQAREFQARPAFADVRRRRQVVEHRIARLVQLGIRQARYIGRTKTLFQLCLAAAVANLTLLAAPSGGSTSEHLRAESVLLAVLTATLSLICSLVWALVVIDGSVSVHRLTRPVLALIPPLQASSRPAF